MIVLTIVLSLHYRVKLPSLRILVGFGRKNRPFHWHIQLHSHTLECTTFSCHLSHCCPMIFGDHPSTFLNQLTRGDFPLF